MKPVGYLLNTKQGPVGEAGLYYDYLVSEDGVFLRVQNPLIKATFCISPAEIRGLSPLEERIELTHGKMPRSLYDLSLGILMASSDREQYLAITWEGEYHLRMPALERAETTVRYQNLPSCVMDIHSHGSGSAWFSGTDNRDEQGLRLSMVVGKLDTLLPEVKIRLGAYGYFAPLDAGEIFDVQTRQPVF